MSDLSLFDLDELNKWAMERRIHPFPYCTSAAECDASDAAFEIYDDAVDVARYCRCKRGVDCSYQDHPGIYLVKRGGIEGRP